MKIAIGNVGSTSLKTKILDIDDANQVTQSGQADLDRVTTQGASAFKHAVGEQPLQQETVSVCGFEDALKLVLDFYLHHEVIGSYDDIEAVGFKTVLAGDRGACLLSDDVIAEMRRFVFVAPMHNTPYIDTIEQFRSVLGNVPLVGVFEPSFHHSIPRFRRVTGLPLEMEERLGLQQKGYHGATGRYGAERVKQMHTAFLEAQGTTFPSPFRVIFNHLGGSSSTHALLDGVSVATTMRFSNQCGHFMGTRIGDIDGIALLYAMKEDGLSVEHINAFLSQECGLKGISGIQSGEMADILKAAEHGNERARLARDAYIDRLKQYIGAYTAVLEGVDAIAFAGGIGEHGTSLRAEVCEAFGYLGLELDAEKNAAVRGQDGRISTDTSRVQVYVVQTNEELVVAYFTKEVVLTGRDLRADEMQFTL